MVGRMQLDLFDPLWVREYFGSIKNLEYDNVKTTQNVPKGKQKVIFEDCSICASEKRS